VGQEVSTFHVGDEVCSYPEFTRGGTHAALVLIDARPDRPQTRRPVLCASLCGSDHGQGRLDGASGGRGAAG
jgi:NADPH:quinone reductase-like Zn-dependent oxidoreductase